ncbi:diacylglycerol kinase family protein [Pseudidiomarina sediminum]|uniref:diacylglycerol kinase family protein n=1 Tax=Pseudidiomarina sediminum TaxID=431675 RepID=UPI001C96322B|nr:diacylglycerol kinase family protein [Pseudidiomarina sediminum]MBY6063667.1 dual specificity protein phosphatase family protein [Pseudidiomarina sediminum]
MQARHIPLYYLSGALLTLFAAIWVPSWWLKVPLLWCFAALALVSAAYWLDMAGLFRKRQGGSIPWYIRWLLVPFLVGVSCYNWLARQRDNLPAWHQVADGLYVGRRLFASDIEALQAQGITAILDVTAEFDALDWSSTDADIAYLNIPVLDHKAPSDRQIHEAMQWLQHQHREGRKVLVHCALGRGRSVFIVAAYLLLRTPKRSVDEVMQLIQSERKVARLNSLQRQQLEKFTKQHPMLLAKSIWLIANPVAGGGKWREEEQNIRDYLSPYFELNVWETSEAKSAADMAQQALREGAELVVAIGGDGTLAEVAGVLRGTAATMALIPLGTANAVSQTLWGISAKVNPITLACETIIEGVQHHVDVGVVNGMPMLQCAAVGFQQQMIEKADREAKNRLGQFAYLQGLWQACSANEVIELEIAVDDGPFEIWQTNSLIVANAAPITTLLAQGRGNPMMDDGKLDMTWIKPQVSGEQHVFSLIELMYSGLTEESLDVNVGHQQVQSVTLRRSDGEAFGYVVDGETYQADTVEISLDADALKLLIPARIEY